MPNSAGEDVTPVMPDQPKTTRELVFTLLRERPTMTDSQLARALGVSRQRILQIRTSGREGPRPSPPQQAPLLAPEVFAEAYERLRHLRAVAVELGVSPSTVRRGLMKAHVPITGPRRLDLDPVTAELVRRVKGGHLVRVAAEACGISYHAARRRLDRAHVAVKPDPDPATEDVVARYRAGASQRELTDYYGCSRKAIARVLREAGEAIRPSGMSRSITLARDPARMPNSARMEHILDDPKALAATLPHEKQVEIATTGWKPVEEDEENLPPHLRKMLNTEGERDA